MNTKPSTRFLLSQWPSFLLSTAPHTFRCSKTALRLTRSRMISPGVPLEDNQTMEATRLSQTLRHRNGLLPRAIGSWTRLRDACKSIPSVAYSRIHRSPTLESTSWTDLRDTLKTSSSGTTRLLCLCSTVSRRRVTKSLCALCTCSTSDWSSW